MSFKIITKPQHEAFIAALAAGQYNLLLGAGASMDSKNAFGELPSGEEFKNNLCDITKASRKHPLQRVFSLLDEDGVLEHVTRRFSACIPGDTPKMLSRFVWKRIFTWNIDDVIENVYALPSAKQNLITIHYNDDFIESQSLADLILIHLHGTVLAAEKGYVFSREHYVKQMQSVNPWMSVLTNFMRSEPMIISGTSLDEIDLDYYLSFRTSTTARDDRGPSILVTKDDDAITADICRKHSLIHFVGYTADFMKYCMEVLPSPPTPEALVPSEARNLLPKWIEKPAAMAFHSDFELVPATASPSDSSRFQYGHTPTWQDLASNCDIPRAIVPHLLVQIEAMLKDDVSPAKLLLLSDQAGTGKTTILRRVAFELAKRGIRTLMCSALSRIDRATADVIDQIENPIVIVVDNFADQVTAVSEMLNRLERKDVVVFATERSYRSRYLRTVLSGIQHNTVNTIPISENEIERLIDKLFELGVVGNHVVLKDKKKSAKNMIGDPIAISCCRIMNSFKPLERIVDETVKDANVFELNRYVCVALAHHCFMGGVKRGILMGAASADGINNQFDRNSALPLAYYDAARNYVIPENATLAERVLARSAAEDAEQLLSTFIALANQLRPFVNRQTITRRTAEARLAGRLFDYDDVAGKLLGDRAEQFYSETQRQWQWNSRYWEQVSLLKLSKYYRNPNASDAYEFLDQAVQCARQAVAIEFHPFGLTTLGKVLMSQMLVPGYSMTAVYADAFDRLCDAIDQETIRGRRAIQPYISLFRGTEKFLENSGQLTDKQRDTLRKKVHTAEQKFPRDAEAVQAIDSLRHLMGGTI